MVTQKFEELGVRAVTDKLIQFISDYAVNNKVRTLVVGVSGGVDSAVVASLCAQAMYRSAKQHFRNHITDLILVQMPIYQHATEHKRGEELIKALIDKTPEVYQNREKTHNYRAPKITQMKVDLSDTFDEIEEAVNAEYKRALYVEQCKPSWPNWSFTGGNTRARLRMTALYHIAGLKGGIVVGTGNKVEDFGIGFFTKYGDGGVDISPIGDLNKSEVYEVAKYLSVPLNIIDAEPTDGLHGSDRETGSTTDAAQLGFDNLHGKEVYGYLEDAMVLIDKYGEGDAVSLKPLLHTDLAKAVDIIIDRRKKNSHKMGMPPVCYI